MIKNFKEVGTWWSNKNISLVEIDNTTYALHGWNGEVYLDCWACTGEFNMDDSEEEYHIAPLYKEVAGDEYEIVGYEITK